MTHGDIIGLLEDYGFVKNARSRNEWVKRKYDKSGKPMRGQKAFIRVWISDYSITDDKGTKLFFGKHLSAKKFMGCLTLHWSNYYTLPWAEKYIHLYHYVSD